MPAGQKEVPRKANAYAAFRGRKWPVICILCRPTHSRCYIANHDNGFQAGHGWVYNIHMRRMCVVEGSDKRFRYLLNIGCTAAFVVVGKGIAVYDAVFVNKHIVIYPTAFLGFFI